MSKPAAGPALLIVSLLVTLAVSGCRSKSEETREERAANATKVRADSTDDATEPIVDDDFKFRIAVPGKGWKLLRQHDASRLHPDAVAGAMAGIGAIYGIVIVERFPGATLSQAAELVWDETRMDYEVEAEIGLDFHGHAAKRRIFLASIDGQRFRYVSTIFLRDDHLYQLISWSLVDTVPVEEIEEFHEAFSLIEGKVEGRSDTRAPIVDADGIGWRIRGGRYESALSGLRIRPPDGWRYVIGLELERLGSDAEVVLLDEARSAYLAVTTERIAAARQAAIAKVARAKFEETVGVASSASFEREVAGQRVEFRRYEKAPLMYLHGIHAGPEALTQLHLWCPLSLADELVAGLDALLGGFEALPADELESLREHMRASPAEQRLFTKGRAYRAGEFLDFDHRVRWTKPPGFWKVDGLEQATLFSAEAVLTAVEVELGVYVALEAFVSTGAPDATLDNLIAGHELRSREIVRVDGVEVHRAETLDARNDPPVAYGYALARQGELLVALTTWSPNDGPPQRAMLDASLDSLSFELPRERTTMVGRTYHDAFHGYSFELPGEFGEPQTAEPGGIGLLTAWSKGDQEVVAVVMPNATSDDEEWTTSFFEQMLRDRVSNDAELGKPERSEGRLGAHTTRHLEWANRRQQLSADILVLGTVIYCVLYVNLSNDDIELVQRSWALGLP